MTFSPAVAIATLSAHVLGGRGGARLRAGVVAALKVAGPPDELVFATHVHAPTTALALTHWMNMLTADDPTIIGYRLGRTSRLLSRIGYASPFGSRSRYDVFGSVSGTTAPLSVIALLHGVSAVDEEVLAPACPLTIDVAAHLALVNAVASWVVFVGHTPDKADAHARLRALAQLGTALANAPAQALLAAVMIGMVQ